MATHGHVLFVEQDGGKRKRPINCYTWHDGHTREAIYDLLHLPFSIFTKQRDAYRKAHSNPEDLSGLKEGYWVYDQHLGFALRAFTERPTKYRQPRGPWTHNYVYDNWLSLIPLQTCHLSYAGWFCQNRFNRWTIVPNKKWCSYPGPDITVVCTHGRLNGYTIEYDMGEDTEYADEVEANFIEHIAALNSHLPHETFLFEDEDPFGRNKRPAVEIRCHYKLTRTNNLFHIIVPFDAIFCELLWKDIEKAYELINTNRVAEDEHLERVLARARDAEDRISREMGEDELIDGDAGGLHLVEDYNDPESSNESSEDED